MFNSILAAQREYSSTETAIGVTIFVVLVAALYLTPTLIALARRVPGAGSIAIINVFFGWTGFWWIHSLSRALAPTERRHTAAAGAAALPAAGWLRDPINPARLRYFDGHRWTDAVAPPRT